MNKYPCDTEDCPGDGRYSAPGRGHREGCTHPLPPSLIEHKPFRLPELKEFESRSQKPTYSIWFRDPFSGDLLVTSETRAKLMAERQPRHIYFFYGEGFEE